MTKRVLITGGAGFIGHHVIDLFLAKTDWEIISLDRLDYSGNLNRLDNVVRSYPPEVRKRVKIVWHDLKAEIAEINQNLIGDVNIILHLAASSHVDRSISHPMEFVQDNTIGTVNLLNYARRLPNLERLIYFSTDEIFGVAPPGVAYKERDRYNSTNPYSASKAAAEEFCVAYENTYKLPIFVTHCHDEITKCVTEKGVVDINELAVGDKVWVLQDNKKMALEPILEIVKSPYVGDMINFKSMKYDLCVTPNHRMLTKIRNKGDEWEIKTAEEMSSIDDRQYIPTTGEWEGIETCIIDIPISETIHHNATPSPLTVNTDIFMEFLGWYLSEGCCRDGKGEILISQKKHSIDRIADLIRVIGYDPKISTREDGVSTCSFHSKPFNEYLSENFGGSSFDKTIPSWVKSLSKRYLQVLFDSMMKGDGSITKGYRRYYTSSKTLADDVAEIGMKIGYSVSIKNRKTYNPTKTKLSNSFYVSFRKPIGGVDKHNISKTTYNGNIWCVRTPSGNFFVSRNGVISCSGNTMNVFGERQHPEKFIPMCIRKIRDGEMISIHADATKTVPGSRFYVHAKDVAEAMLFLLNLNDEQLKLVHTPDEYGTKCPKFNVVGKEEIDNLSLVKYIAAAVGKNPNYELVDFHTSRPGHDLRYALDGGYMRSLGWEPRFTLQHRIKEVVDWSLVNKEWIEL